MFAFSIVVLCFYGLCALFEFGTLIYVDQKAALGINALKVPLNILFIVYLAICIAKF